MNITPVIQSLLFLTLIIFAAFLRFFRIHELTEFLADQGRTGIVIYQAWIDKALPLVGPPVLTGQHLGPFFYYLVFPSFVLSGFNPLGPALFMSLLGVLTVVFVFYIGNRMFGFWIGLFIGLLYAVSPALVAQARTLWDPTPIPFFVLLVIVFFYKIYQEKKFRWFLMVGALLGILVQLHYPNVFFIPLSLFFSLSIYFLHRSAIKQIVGWSLLGILTFFATLAPFLVYEAQHAFVDLREIALIFLLREEGTTTVPFFGRVLDTTSRLFHTIFPFNQWLTLLLASLTIFVSLVKPRFWHIFFAGWLIVGIFAISLYRGTMFDHYLNFLIPVVFFLLGFAIKTSQYFLNRNTLIAIVFVLLLLNLRNVDIFSKGNNDILRTEHMTDEIMNQTNNAPFSFTIISSRSFTDLHYRYFFLLRHVEPEKITNNSYDLLFLVCEKEPCLTPSEKELVQVMCYDAHCEGEYPKIYLEDFALISSKDIFDGKIFTYKRKENSNTK